MKYVIFPLFALLMILFTGCVKKQPDNCAEIKQVRIVVEKDKYFVGEEIHLKVNQLPTIALFQWRHDGTPNVISGNEEVHIPYAEKGDEGWYHLNVSYPDCASHNDSVYISVTSKEVPAPCSPGNNAVTFSSIPAISPATVTWSLDNTWNRKVMAARGAYGYPDLNIYFNAYWNTKEPEDGEYSITTMSATGEYPPYTVYISSLYQSVFFSAGSGKVYVSHVNGKVRVTFCSIPLSGSNGGPSLNTTATGMLTAP
jgi:hypothetical protein